MTLATWVRLYRLVFGVLAIWAVIQEFIDRNLHKVDFVASNFWSLFTNHSNLFAGAVLIAGAILPTSRTMSRNWELTRGASVMFMTTTGVVYAALLGGLFNPFDGSRTWMSAVLHQLIPIVVVVDLLIRPPGVRLQFREALVWTVYPITYLIYSLVRGPFVDWYPYDFIDPHAVGGYTGVTLYTLVITIGFLLMTAFVVTLSHLAGRRITVPSAQEVPSM